MLQKLVRDAVLRTFDSLTEDDVRSTGMGQSGVDVQLSTAAKALFPYSVECKNKERMSVFDEWKQTVANVQPDTKPILVIKRNRADPLVVLKLDDFMELVKRVYGDTH